MFGNFACCLLSAEYFFKSNFSNKSFEEYHQNVKQFVSIWVQSVCKGYQQMTNAATSKERVKCVDKTQLSLGYSHLNVSELSEW